MYEIVREKFLKDQAERNRELKRKKKSKNYNDDSDDEQLPREKTSIC